ncbi:mCG1036020, partial [Mus musculus]
CVCVCVCVCVCEDGTPGCWALLLSHLLGCMETFCLFAWLACLLAWLVWFGFVFGLVCFGIVFVCCLFVCFSFLRSNLLIGWPYSLHNWNPAPKMCLCSCGKIHPDLLH